MTLDVPMHVTMSPLVLCSQDSDVAVTPLYSCIKQADSRASAPYVHVDNRSLGWTEIPLVPEISHQSTCPEMAEVAGAKSSGDLGVGFAREDQTQTEPQKIE